MKKVLTILVVLTVIAGFAFAASEQHKLEVTAKVLGEAPKFQLYKDSVVTNDAEEPVAFKNGETYQDAFEASFNLDAGGVVTVSARVANKAKEVQAYTLTFSDGEFAVTKNDEDATIVPTIAASAASGTITGVTVEKTAAAQVTASFNGTKMTAEGQTLASATYTYGADSAIDPGTYTANIVLTVAAV